MSAKRSRWKLAIQITAEVIRRWRAGDRGTAHAASLAEDLDDAGATIADYRGALTVMQRERDQLRELAAEMADDVEHLISGNAGYIDRDMVTDYRQRAGIEVTP